MIRTLITLPIVTALSVLGIWAATLVLFSDPANHLLTLMEDLERAFPSPGHPETLMEEAYQWARPLEAALSRNLGLRRAGLLEALMVTHVHTLLLACMTPFLVATLLSGLLAGASLRERLRYGRGYASPSLAYVSRILLSLGILVLLAFTFTPLPLPIVFVFPAVLGSSLGGCLYVANLPLRL